MSTPAGGWVRFGPPLTLQQSAQRRAAAAAQAAADRARRARARAAAYGASTDHTTTTRTMPLSGVRFTWRADGYFHVTLPGAPDPADPDWLPWSGDPDITGHSQSSPGDSADPTWCLWCGQARETDTVTAWLADGADAPVTRLGGLWICEFTAVAQPLYLARNGVVDYLPARRPAYLPPPQHPWQQDATNPRA